MRLVLGSFFRVEDFALRVKVWRDRDDENTSVGE